MHLTYAFGSADPSRVMVSLSGANVPIGPMIIKLPRASAIHPGRNPHTFNAIINPAVITTNAQL